MKSALNWCMDKNTYATNPHGVNVFYFALWWIAVP